MFIDSLSRTSAIYDWQGAGKLDFNRDWKLLGMLAKLAKTNR